jgi:hypothetical protein
MEQASGTDLGGVRVHVGARADQLNDALRSHAFTAGRDVFVRRSRYRPGTRAGDELLAHELTHTVQQATPALQRKFGFELELGVALTSGSSANPQPPMSNPYPAEA